MPLQALEVISLQRMQAIFWLELLTKEEQLWIKKNAPL
jgi:hypothetical protein